MRLWGVRDSCGWCLYRVQGCVVIVAIFCPFGNVKPHLRLRIGGSWWVERAVSACVPKDPYAREADDTWVSSLEHSVATWCAPCVSVQDKMSNTSANEQPRANSIRRDGGNDDLGISLVARARAIRSEWQEQPTRVCPFLYASTMALLFVYRLRLFVSTRQTCKPQRASHNVFILMFQHKDIGD